MAIGGDLSTERLKLAYRSGIFPWYSGGQPILRHCPDPRMVLYPDALKISKVWPNYEIKSLSGYFNQSFDEVIRNCKTINRSKQGEEGTWITDEMQQAYINLHKEGWAKSVEVWEDKELVGGLYGVEVGSVGESMFSMSNTSKLALLA